MKRRKIFTTLMKCVAALAAGVAVAWLIPFAVDWFFELYAAHPNGLLIGAAVFVLTVIISIAVSI